MLMIRRLSLMFAGLLLLAISPTPAPTPTRAAAAPLPTPAPIITTLAGPRYGLDGTGQAASFSQPNGIALSPDARFALVADSYSHTLRRIDMSTRLVTTIAGLAGARGSADGVGAVARFNAPYAIRISPDSSFALVIDAKGLRRINLATFAVSTIGPVSVGGGMEISADGAAAWHVRTDRPSPSSPELFFLTKINLANGTETSIAALGGFMTNTVLALAVSRDETFALIAINGLGSSSYTQIWRFDLVTQQFRLLSGQATTSLCQPSDTTSTTPAVLCYVNSIAISSDNSFALISNSFSRVGRVDLATGAVTTIAGNSINQGSADGVGSSATFFNLYDIAISQDRSFALALDAGNYNVRRVSLVAEGTAPPYTVTTLVGQLPYGKADGIGQVARFGEPSAIALSGDDSFAIVVDAAGTTSTLRRVQAQDGALAVGTTTLLALPDTAFIDSVALSRDGSFGLLFSKSAIWRFDPQVITPTLTLVAGAAGSPGNADGTGAGATFSAGGNNFSSTLSSLALSADGSFALLADAKNNTIRKIVLASGAVTTLAGDPSLACTLGTNQGPCNQDGVGAAAHFNAPVDISISPDGSFALIADFFNDSLRRLDLATGAVSTVVNFAPYQVNSVALSADGSYALIKYDIHDGSGKNIKRVDTATWRVDDAIPYFDDGWGLLFNGDIALSANGSFALITDPQIHTIRRLGAPPAGERVTTLAGQAGRSGANDGTGFGARFGAPTGVAVSDTGIALMADSTGHTLRRIVVSNGDVFTIAGQANGPGNIDGDQKTARLNKPTGVAIDRIATFGLVADTGNSSIRKIDLRSGQLTTISDPASFSAPMGVALACGDGPIEAITDPAADCPYAVVADTGNNTIRKIDLATHTVTTIAGLAGSPGNVDAVGGAARFNRPTGVSVAYGGAFAIIADEGNHALRRIDLNTNEVSTVLGGLTTLAARPDALTELPSLDAVVVCGGERLLVSNAADHTVTQVNLGKGTQSALAGKTNTAGAVDGAGAQARFNGPSGIASSCYGGGTTIVGDTNNSTAREIDAQGQRVYMPTVIR
jgi:sugar lactone lactonase YvrE